MIKPISSRKERLLSRVKAGLCPDCTAAMYSVRQRLFPISRAILRCAAPALDVVVVSREVFHELFGKPQGQSGNIEQIMSSKMRRDVDLDEEMADVMSSTTQV